MSQNYTSIISLLFGKATDDFNSFLDLFYPKRELGLFDLVKFLWFFFVGCLALRGVLYIQMAYEYYFVIRPKLIAQKG